MTSWGEGASLVFVGHACSHSIAINILSEVEVLIITSSAPHIFLFGWLKLNLSHLVSRVDFVRLIK